MNDLDLDDKKFYVEKIIGFVIEEVKREIDDSFFLWADEIVVDEDGCTHSCFDKTVEEYRKSKVLGVIPATDCYKVFGLNERTQCYDFLGFINGKASQPDWEEKRKELK